MNANFNRKLCIPEDMISVDSNSFIPLFSKMRRNVISGLKSCLKKHVVFEPTELPEFLLMSHSEVIPSAIFTVD